MQPTDLLQSARILLAARKGRPTDVCLRRATSSAYYALFHCLARACADLLIGKSKATRSNEAWHQVYRALDHGQTKDRCRDKATLRLFPKTIEDFASTFITLQEKRHRADYDPAASFSKSEVERDIDLAAQVVSDFGSSGTSDRRAFCAFVLLKKRG